MSFILKENISAFWSRVGEGAIFMRWLLPCAGRHEEDFPLGPKHTLNYTSWRDEKTHSTTTANCNGEFAVVGDLSRSYTEVKVLHYT